MVMCVGVSAVFADWAERSLTATPLSDACCKSPLAVRMRDLARLKRCRTRRSQLLRIGFSQRPSIDSTGRLSDEPIGFEVSLPAACLWRGRLGCKKAATAVPSHSPLQPLQRLVVGSHASGAVRPSTRGATAIVEQRASCSIVMVAVAAEDGRPTHKATKRALLVKGKKRLAIWLAQSADSSRPRPPPPRRNQEGTGGSGGRGASRQSEKRRSGKRSECMDCHRA